MYMYMYIYVCVRVCVCMYVSKTHAPKYIKQMLTDVKEETDSNSIIVREFNNPLHQLT